MILKVLSVSSFIVIIDRLTKYYALKNINEAQPVTVVPGLFHFTLVLNSGAAFGLFKGGGFIFIISSILVLTFIFIYIRRNRYADFLLLVAAGLISGGAIGNLIDRIVFGYVIDFLDFRIWPVFNIADASITTGAFILAIRLILDRKCCTK